MLLRVVGAVVLALVSGSAWTAETLPANGSHPMGFRECVQFTTNLAAKLAVAPAEEIVETKTVRWVYFVSREGAVRLTCVAGTSQMVVDRR